MLDASIRRFKIQQTYLKASAALRWVNSRNAILGTNRPQSIHTPALQQITNTMRAVSFSCHDLSFISLFCLFRTLLAWSSGPAWHDPNRAAGFLAQTQQLTWLSLQELASVTPARVELALRSQDSLQGKWLAEDPTLTTMQESIRTGR